MTTSTRTPSSLEEAIRLSGEGWLLDRFRPPGGALNHIRGTLQRVDDRARERLRGDAPRFSESALLEEYPRNPQQVRAFFQAIGGTRSPDMLLMAWRIIQGMEVKDVHIQYRRQETFEMTVILESPDGGEDEVYTSNKIYDLALFRHLGLSEIGDLPVIDGFYALSLRDSASRD